MGPKMHPATEAILLFFEYDHLPPHLQEVSQPFHDLAHDIVPNPTHSVKDVFGPIAVDFQLLLNVYA